jgi:hypothetical protein
MLDWEERCWARGLTGRNSDKSLFRYDRWRGDLHVDLRSGHCLGALGGHRWGMSLRGRQLVDLLRRERLMEHQTVFRSPKAQQM